MAQAVYDEHPLEQYLRDEAGEAPELMPGAAAEFLDDEREFPDGEDADALTPLQTYVLEIIEVVSNLAQQLNASSSPSPFVERFKYHVISSSLLSESVASSSNRLPGTPPPPPGNLEDEPLRLSGASREPRQSLTAAISSGYPEWVVPGGIALLACLLSAGAYALVILICAAAAAALSRNQDNAGRPDYTATLDAMNALVSAGNMWDSAVSEALQVIERDEQRMVTSASSPSTTPTSPLRIALNSSMHSTQTQCDNVRQLFVALTSPTELAPLAEMYAPSSPSRPPYAELPNAERPLSLPTRKRTSSLTSLKRSTWNGSYAALANAGSPTMQVLTHRQKRRSDLSSLLQVNGGSPVKSRSAPGTPKTPKTPTTPSLGGVQEEEADEVDDSPHGSISSFGSAALDLRRKRRSMGLQTLGLSSSRSSSALGSTHPLSLMSLTNSVHDALAARRYACAHTLALRFDDEDELYWEDVRSVMSLLTGTLADTTARLTEAFEEVDTQKLRDEQPTPTLWEGGSSFDAGSRRSSLNLEYLKKRVSWNMDAPRSSGGEVKNRRSSMLRHAMSGFAPTPGPLARFAAHVHVISSALDDAREELERTVAALKEEEAGEASPRVSEDGERKEHPALAAYERLRRELGLALRECERGRDRLLDTVSPPPPPAAVGDDSEDMPNLTHDLSDDSDKPEPAEEDMDPYGGIAAHEPDGEYVGAAPDFRDDVAATLMANARLTPPGAEQVFEDDSAATMARLRERPKLSREERIKAARAAREKAKEEGLPSPRGFGPGGEVVQELKDVIWKVGERRRRLTLDTQPKSPSRPSRSPQDTPSPEYEAAPTPPRMRYEDFSSRMSIVLDDLPRISLDLPPQRRAQMLPTLHEDSPVIPRSDLPRLPALEEFGFGRSSEDSQ
ncbi:hypothetical protein GGF50DRAFT_105241 [Schizophyllum commune]